MAVLQTTYSERMPIAVAGLVANETTYDADSRLVETAAGIPFGRVCGKGAAANGVILGASAATGVIGISVRDITLVPEAADVYRQRDLAAIMFRGDIWVAVAAAVVAGDEVTFAQATGEMSSAAPGAGVFALPIRKPSPTRTACSERAAGR
jgi:hypothetical protein